MSSSTPRASGAPRVPKLDLDDIRKSIGYRHYGEGVDASDALKMVDAIERALAIPYERLTKIEDSDWSKGCVNGYNAALKRVRSALGVDDA
jgi:hypothetical protein